MDWDATHKSEAEQASHDAELKAKIRASDLAMHTKDIDVDRSLEIKPGLFLPDAVGFYALDRDKLIREMKQSTAEVKTVHGPRSRKNFERGSADPRARKRWKFPESARPCAWTRPSRNSSCVRPMREPRFRLLRAQVKGGHRVIDSISVHFTGEEKHKTTDIEIQTWTPATWRLPLHR